jgi:hypothetical protein
MKKEGKELFKEIMKEAIASSEIDLESPHTSFMIVFRKFKKVGGWQFLESKLSKEEDQVLTKIFLDILSGLGIEIKDKIFIRRTEPKKIKRTIPPEILEGARKADFRHHRALGNDY